MSIYLKIKLTPLDKFFFGGEIVLGGADAQDERRRSYLVKSNLLPQQTTLLGMLRSQLLAQNNLLIEPNDLSNKQNKINEAIKLIGREASIQESEENDFGVIEKISPLFIEDANGKRWQPASRDNIKGKDGQLVQFQWDNETLRPVIPNLDTKSWHGLEFIAIGSSSKPLVSFFAEESQVGITVTNRKKNLANQNQDDEEAFYRQTFKRNYDSSFAASLNSSNPNHHKQSVYSFTFWVELSQDYSNYKPLVDTIVQLGGERSMFSMKIETVNSMQNFDSLIEPTDDQAATNLSNQFHRIILISDTYVDWQQLQADCALVFAQTIPFRYFYSPLNITTHFYDFKSSKTTGKQQSSLMTLIQRGGVFFVNKEKINNVKSLLTNQAFRQIGYNYFKII